MVAYDLQACSLQLLPLESEVRISPQLHLASRFPCPRLLGKYSFWYFQNIQQVEEGGILPAAELGHDT